MASNFWFKFYFKDWSDDVKPLSLTARGLLLELIIELRKRGGEMPIDIRFICRLSGGLTDEVTQCLEEFREHEIFDFKKRGEKEFLVSRKILKEQHTSLINTENGKLGGNPNLKKKEKRISEPLKRTRNPTSISNSISNSDSLFKNETDSDVHEVSIFPSFEDFWNAYDKKVDPKTSKGLWLKLTQDMKEKIMNYLPDYKLAEPNKKYRKNPETFLRNESWNDEIIKHNGNQQTHQGGGKATTKDIIAAVIQQSGNS